MRSRPTPKFGAVAVIALAAIGLGVGWGEPDLLVAATPLVVAAAYGLARPEPGEPTVALELDEQRCFEGDVVDLRVDVVAPLHSEVEAAVHYPSALRPLDGSAELVVTAGAGRMRDRRIRFAVDRWGSHRLGPIALRSYAKNGLMVREEVRQVRVLVKAFPEFLSVDQPISPSETKALTGNYVSARSAEGIEFSQVRPFTRGDPIRRINWRVTSRSGNLHVNLWHPERNAEVMLFLDTFDDIGVPGRSSLDLTIRGAAAVARRYLRDKDRVGLISFGGALRWINSSMGRTQIYRITDFLLDTNATFSYAWKGVDVLPPRSLPPNSLVFAFTPLVDPRVTRALEDLHARGFPMIVVDTLHKRDIAPLKDAEDRLAHRVWLLHRRSVKWGLIDRGIPVIELETETIEAGLARLERGRAFRKVAHR
jgi:uncharacterized protein (DUF58 family)